MSYNNIRTIQNISHLKKLKKLYLLSNKIKKVPFHYQKDPKPGLPITLNAVTRFKQDQKDLKPLKSIQHQIPVHREEQNLTNLKPRMLDKPITNRLRSTFLLIT